jgi:hypothetical protein
MLSSITFLFLLICTHQQVLTIYLEDSFYWDINPEAKSIFDIPLRGDSVLFVEYLEAQC